MVKAAVFSRPKDSPISDPLLKMICHTINETRFLSFIAPSEVGCISMCIINVGE